MGHMPFIMHRCGDPLPHLITGVPSPKKNTPTRITGVSCPTKKNHTRITGVPCPKKPHQQCLQSAIMSYLSEASRGFQMYIYKQFYFPYFKAEGNQNNKNICWQVQGVIRPMLVRRFKSGRTY